MMNESPVIPDRVVTVVSDGFVVAVSCDDDRLEAVLEGLQRFLLTLDIDLALLTIQSGAEVAAEQREVELVRHSAMRN
jgi:hypothetical protein